MFYNEKMPPIAAKTRLVERRVKFTESQDKELLSLSERIDVPVAALVRMAIDSFLPKTKNSGFTDNGIKAGHLNGGY